jgi:hypothetical protein
VNGGLEVLPDTVRCPPLTVQLGIACARSSAG